MLGAEPFREHEERAVMKPGTDELRDPSVGKTDRQLVEQVVARSLRIAVDPTSRSRSGTHELALLAGHDRSVLGLAGLELVVPALRHPTGPVVAAERLLSAALEAEGRDERVHASAA